MWTEANGGIKRKLYVAQKRAWLLSSSFRLRFLLIILLAVCTMVLILSIEGWFRRGSVGFLVFSLISFLSVIICVSITLLSVYNVASRLQYFRERSNKVYYCFGVIESVFDTFSTPTVSVKLQDGVFLLSSLVNFTEEDLGKKVIVFSHSDKSISKPYNMDNYIVIDYSFFEKCEIFY